MLYNFGKRLNRNWSSDLSFSLKGPNLVSHSPLLSPDETFPSTGYGFSNEKQPSFLPEAIKVYS